MNRLTTAAALLLILGVLSACSVPASSTTSGTAPASSTSAPAKPAEVVGDGTADHPLAFGQTWGTDKQIRITLGAPAPYTPSASAFTPGGAAARAVALSVTITTPADLGKAFPAMLLTTQATAGGTQAQSIEDVGNNVGSPTASVLPGKSLSWRVAFGVPAGASDITVQVSTAIGGQPVFFAGKI